MACEVIAPDLVPVKASDRVKTDRRDAEKLARCYRAGELTAVWVSDAAQRRCVTGARARSSEEDQPRRGSGWGSSYCGMAGSRRRHKGVDAEPLEWITLCRPARAGSDAQADRDEVNHAHERSCCGWRQQSTRWREAPAEIRAVVEALQAMRGVAKTTAVTIVSEVGVVALRHTRQLMGYSGVVPSEHSSGGPGKARRGAITKTGNAHLRRVRDRSGLGVPAPAAPSGDIDLKKRQGGSATTRSRRSRGRRSTGCIDGIASSLGRGKHRQQVVTADRPRAPGLHLGDRRARSRRDLAATA